MGSIDARIVKRLPAVKDTPAFELDVHIRAQEGIYVLLGASGAGKTLLLNCLGGFIRPDEGRILVHDRLYFDAATQVHLRPELRRCGYIFQDHALFPHMTIRENLRFAASLPSSRGSSLNVRRRVNDLLDTFDLNNLGERKPAQLSGGQKQRAALARILITNPGILLLDEPSRGLDAHLRDAFYKLLRSVRERIQGPILLVSHSIEECLELASSVAVLHAGKLAQEGPRETVLAKPATMEIARLLGIYNIAPAAITFLDPSANLSRVRVLGQEIEGPYFPGHLLGDSGYVCLRRSEWKLAGVNDPPSPNQLTLDVEDRLPSAHGVRLLLESDLFVDLSETEARSLDDTNRLTFTMPRSSVSFTGK